MSVLAEELTDIRLGDLRLNRRARRLLAKLGDKPTARIPAACGGWDETRAAYRLFDNPKVTAEAVLAPHLACTEERLRAQPRVLCIQDTTELDHTDQKGIAGLGPLNYETRWGMSLHPTLAVTPERVPLGLLDLFCSLQPPVPSAVPIGWCAFGTTTASSPTDAIGAPPSTRRPCSPKSPSTDRPPVAGARAPSSSRSRSCVSPSRRPRAPTAP